MKDLKESSEVKEEEDFRGVVIKAIKTEEAIIQTTEVGVPIREEKKVMEQEVLIKEERKEKVIKVVIKEKKREKENIRLKEALTEAIEEITPEEDIRKTTKITNKEKIDHTTRNLTVVTNSVAIEEMKKKEKKLN